MHARPHLMLAVATVVVGCLTSPAEAQLHLLQDTDGTIFIENVGSQAIRFDGYSLSSTDGILRPELWVSLEDSFAADPLAAIAALGVHGMSEANPTRFSLAELSAGAGATLQPGASWSIGQPLGSAPTRDEFCSLILEYTDPDGVVGGGTQSAGSFSCIPEPSSLLLALVGLPLCYLWQQRARRA